MQGLIVRRPVLAHFLFSTGLAAIVVILAIAWMFIVPASASALPELFNSVYAGPGFMNMVTIGQAVFGSPSLISVFAFAAAPTIIALWMARRVFKGGARALLARLHPIGPDGELKRSLKIYAAIVVVYAGGLFVYDWVAGPGVDAYARLSGFGVPAASGAIIALFVDEGGTLEELGWRGFAWPLLLATFQSPFRAALLLGFLHWAWHLPREVVTFMGGVDPTMFLTSQAIFLVLTLALAIVTGYCVNLTGGSALPAIFVHGGTNVWSKAMGEYVSPSFGLLDLRTLLVIVLAVAIVVFAGSKLGLREFSDPRRDE